MSSMEAQKESDANCCIHRRNEVTPEVNSLVDELKSVSPKDRKKVPIHKRIWIFELLMMPSAQPVLHRIARV